MKYLIYVLSICLILSSTAFGAGSSSFTPSLAPEIKEYNKGVDLMMKKKFSQAELDYQKLKGLNRSLASELRFAIDNGSKKSPKCFLVYPKNSTNKCARQ